MYHVPLLCIRRSLVAGVAFVLLGCSASSPERATRSRLQADFPLMLLVRVVEVSTRTDRERPQRTAMVTLVLDVYSLEGWQRMTLPARLVFIEEGKSRWELLSLGENWNESGEDFRVFDRARWAESYASMPEAWVAIQEDLKAAPPASTRAGRIVEAVQLLKQAVEQRVIRLEQVHDGELRERLGTNTLSPVL